MKQCANCKNQLDETDIIHGYCCECADGAFNVDLGLEFLEKYDFEEEFILRRIWNISVRHVDKKLLVNILKKEFREVVNDDSWGSNKKHFINELRHCCLFDHYDHWVEFIKLRKGTEVAA